MTNMETRTQPAGLGLPGTLLAVVCVTTAGAGVMLYEFLAIRILQRFFGGAMDVWASEIAICLAGLALGYAVGGVLADRYRSWAPIAWAFLIAAATACLTEPLAVWAGTRLMEVEAGFYWHPLLAAGLSSFVPLFALGTVTPQVIRLQTKDIEHVGASAGLLFAVSTVGSIVGVLATPPLLLRWSVLHVLWGTSALLGLLGACVIAAVLGGGLPRRAVACVFLAAALIAAPARAQEKLYERYTAHHHIIVDDLKEIKIRRLRFDNAVQSIMSLDDPQRGGFDYTEFFHVPFVFNPTTRRVLFLGLGGGTGPKAVLQDYPGVLVDVVEIDPEVERVARKYFHLPEDPLLEVTLQDGRVFLNRTKETYGAIIMDAYGSGRRGAYLPYHMATREFFELVSKRLEPGGGFFYNVMGEFHGHNHDVAAGVLATLREVFGAVYVFEAEKSINTLFVAVKTEGMKRPDPTAMEKAVEWPEAPWDGHPADGPKLGELTKQLYEEGFIKHGHFAKKFSIFAPAHFEPANARVLTDDRAPVDILPRR